MQLPIIEMSDQHTRVTMGGSPIKSVSPIIGLLFGTVEDSVISILDAQEIEYSYAVQSKEENSNDRIMEDAGSKMGGFGGGTKEEQTQFQENVKTKIELHNMVFPTHQVLGWYRVDDVCNTSNSIHDPTPNDLAITNGPMVKLTENPMFLLMNASANSLETNHVDDEKNGELDDNELPISIFELLVDNAGQAAFVGMEFELETFEPERIAVEKVLKTQPSTVPPTVAASKGYPSSLQDTPETNQAKQDQNPSKPHSTYAHSALNVQLQSLQNSIQSMDTRINVLINYLQKAQEGSIPSNPRLLRHIQNIISQLPIRTPQPDMLQSKLQDELHESLILSFVATVAKTSQTIEQYSEKFRSVYESNAHRDARRTAGGGAGSGSAGSGSY